ncbi:hypothetical protein HEAFMP_HEAFMP_04105, partial [Dysosmobacter welbionis]
FMVVASRASGPQQIHQAELGLVLPGLLRKQLVPQDIGQRLRLEVPLEHSPDGHGDGPGLLGDDDHHGVGVLAHADTGPVAHPQLPGEVHVLAERQHASGAKHPPVPDDDGAVMHGSLYKEDVFQQFAGDRRVQHRAAADHVVQQVFPLEHDQGAGAGLGHLGAGQHRLVDG